MRDRARRELSRVLLGLKKRPRYILPNRPEAASLIVQYWRSRWLSRRIENPEVIADVRAHSLTHPIQHGARVTLHEDDEIEPFDARESGGTVEDPREVISDGERPEQFEHRNQAEKRGVMAVL